jgi:N6-adenosine-specific RNA methylase IME4
VDETQRLYHEVANIFPLMLRDDFDTLKADIAVHGQREPIWLHTDGSIIDGRNRHRACVELGITPIFRTWSGEGSLVNFVVSLNLHRRHLDTGQRAMIGLKVKEALTIEIAAEKERKGREAAIRQWHDDKQEMGLIEFDQTHPAHSYMTSNDEVKNVKTQFTDDARDALAEAAESVNVSKNTMIRAQAVERHAPPLAAKVAMGEVSLNAAYRVVQHQQKQVAPPLPTNKYRIWYADPPWSYGNSGAIGDNDNYGRAERHYPTMSIAELCAMGADIKTACEDNAVLFMWVTSPLLAECFPVIKAWGFEYKTSFVWDKIGHNFGHYNSVRHELLLVCTRGSCTPDNPKLYDSVISIEKSRVHSEKPEEFRHIIDNIYPNGRRIELFARRAVEGWDAWGNEN